jgi:DNA-binding Lrp family transcriptional regulator
VPAAAPAQHRSPGEQQLRSPSVVHAFVLIEAELAQVADLAEALADVDGVAEVYSVASDDADLVAIIRVRRHEDLAEVVTRRIAALGGIRSTSTMVAFKSYSRHDLEAMWDLGPA